jgi:hypothetical protein
MRCDSFAGLDANDPAHIDQNNDYAAGNNRFWDAF